MAATLNYDIKPYLKRFRSDNDDLPEDEKNVGKFSRWEVLTYLILCANGRNRAWPKQETIAKDLGVGKDQVNTSIEWLRQRMALYVVPYDKRVGKAEKQLHNRTNVYQLTGIILFTGEEQPVRYLHLKPGEESELALELEEMGAEDIAKYFQSSTPEPREPEAQSSTVGSQSSTPEPSQSSTVGASHSIEQESSSGEQATNSSSSINDEASETPPDPATPAPEDDEDLENILQSFSEISGSKPSAKDRTTLASYRDKYGSVAMHKAVDTAKRQDNVKTPRQYVCSILENDYRPLAAPRVKPEPPTPSIDWHPDAMPAPDVWTAAMGQLQMQLHAATYDTWLKGAVLVGSSKGCFTVWVPTDYARDWCKQRLYRLIQHTASAVAGCALEFEFIAPQAQEAAVS